MPHITVQELLRRRQRLRWYAEPMAVCIQPYSSIHQVSQYAFHNVIETAKKSKKHAAMLAGVSLFMEIK
jgi:hypothetical protein